MDQRTALGILERRRCTRIETGFGGKRMMHQRDDVEALSFVRDFVGQNAKRQSVDKHGATIRYGGEHMHRFCTSRRAWERKARVEQSHVYLPTAVTQAVDDSSVVTVAAGPRTQVAGDENSQV